MSRSVYFQLLPGIIIQRIVSYTDHVSISDRYMLLDREDIRKKAQKISFALSHTCQAWRTIILGLMYHKCELYTDAGYCLISSDKSIIYSEFHNSMPYPKGTTYVRHLSIIIDIPKIALGNAIALLHSTNIGELYFPSVTKLDIILNTPFIDYADNIGTIDNIDAFVKYIFHIIPNPVHIGVHTTSSSIYTAHEVYYDHANYLAYCLLTKARRLTWTLSNGYTIPNKSETIVPNSLTEINCHLLNKNECTFKLIHINSQSLETLIIDLGEENALTRLIFDEKGAPVNYPYLYKLSFKGHVAPSFENRASFPDIAPFPQLHTLIIYCRYPFGDDVLFRDNSKTLKVLQCEFDYETIMMINTLISKRTIKLPCLESLTVNTSSHDVDNNEQMKQAFLMFIKEIGAGVKKLYVRDINVETLAMERIKKVRDDKWGECICDLALHTTSLNFPQVIDLLKALPSLERLSSGLAEYEPLTESLEDPKFLDNFYKENYQACSKFRIWTVYTGAEENVEYSVIYSIMLALACPGFYGIRLSSTHMVEYRETMKILTMQYPYKKYAGVSIRLLPGISWRKVVVK